MKIKYALLALQQMDPEDDLVVAMELDEDLKPGQSQTYIKIKGFRQPSRDQVTYLDPIALEERNGHVVVVDF